MNIKSYLCLAIFTCLSAISAHGHCQVPCGIFADQHRFEQMLEDQATIEKASKLIAELSAKRCIVAKPVEQVGCDQGSTCLQYPKGDWRIFFGPAYQGNGQKLRKAIGLRSRRNSRRHEVQAEHRR